MLKESLFWRNRKDLSFLSQRLYIEMCVHSSFSNLQTSDIKSLLNSKDFSEVKELRKRAVRNCKDLSFLSQRLYTEMCVDSSFPNLQNSNIKSLINSKDFSEVKEIPKRAVI